MRVQCWVAWSKGSGLTFTARSANNVFFGYFKTMAFPKGCSKFSMKHKFTHFQINEEAYQELLVILISRINKINYSVSYIPEPLLYIMH